MIISYTGKYATIIRLARQHNATEVSIQYHLFVSFDSLVDAKEFSKAIKTEGLNPWEINTQRPGIPFEVIVEREK